MAENTWVCLRWKKTKNLSFFSKSIYNDRLGGPFGEACGPPGGILLSFLLVWWGNLKQDFFSSTALLDCLRGVVLFLRGTEGFF